MDWSESTITIKADGQEIEPVRRLLRSATLITTREERRWWQLCARITVTGPRWKLAELRASLERVRDSIWWANQI